MPSTSSCTRESRMCPGHWGGLLESWQRKISTSSPAIRQSRKIPRRQAWCLKFLIWRKRSARTEALLLTDWTTDRVMALVQEAYVRYPHEMRRVGGPAAGQLQPRCASGSKLYKDGQCETCWWNELHDMKDDMQVPACLRSLAKAGSPTHRDWDG